MFCYQCEQTERTPADRPGLPIVGLPGCTTARGNCGKDATTADLQELLLFVVQGIGQYARRARAAGVPDDAATEFALFTVFTTLTNVNSTASRFVAMIREAAQVRDRVRAAYEAFAWAASRRVPPSAPDRARGKISLVAEVTSRFQQLRDRHGWLDHLVRAGARYTERHGNDYGAAVTYFSVLSLVPVTMVVFAAAGFALDARPEVVERLKNEITAAWPGALGDTINSVINQAISSAATVGFFGLLVALYAGIGWMTNLRDALSAQWGHVPTPPPIVKRVPFDLLALLGLGLALAVTFALTGLLSRFAGTVLAFLGLADHAWAELLLTLLGVLVGLAANWLIFAWVIARLPREQVPLRSAAKAAVLGAVGFEVLKQGMAVYLQTITRTPSGAVFGSTLGLLVFIYYASRFVLFVTAWAATSRENQSQEPVAVPRPAVIRSEVVVAPRPSGGTAAGLLGAGAVAGLLGALLIRRRCGCALHLPSNSSAMSGASTAPQ